MIYYAIYRGWKTGIFHSWDECYKLIYKYPRAKYKKFSNKDAALHYYKTGTLKQYIPSNTYTDDINNSIYIYTDGASSKNNHGIGIYIPSLNIKQSYNVSSKSNHVTNNICELLAVKTAIEFITDKLFSNKQIIIYTDSNYTKLCCTTYGYKLHLKNWDSDVPNLALIKKLFLIFNSFKNLEIRHIEAHTSLDTEHHNGNRIADNLAVLGKTNKTKSIIID